MEIDAYIASITQITPTVKSFVLDFDGVEMPFLPGQNIEVIIDTGPDVIVGGFSITSSPLHRGKIELAIRRPYLLNAASYLYDVAQVGEPVLVLGPSGNFSYQPEMGKSLSMIAGGIGITPIMSIIRFIDEAKLDVEATLLYSAESEEEFVFLDELQAISARNPKLQCLYTITGEAGEGWKGRTGRIDADLLKESVKDRSTLFYVCGSVEMVKDMTAILQSLDVPTSQIRTESW